MKLTRTQYRDASEVIRKMVRKAGRLLVWTDEELDALAAQMQFKPDEDWNEDRKRGDW